MPNTQTVDKFFDAVTEAYDALLDAAKSANDRGYRVSRRLIDEIERGQRDAVDLTRRVAVAPADIAGSFTSAVRSLTDSQGRVLDLTRQLLDEATDSGREGRDTMRKVIEANRSAGQAAIEATRETLTRGAERVQNLRPSANGTKASTATTPAKPRSSSRTTTSA
jgi:cell division septum initiation protein DivIVA